MRVLVGTSGFSFKEWKGYFYPQDLPAAGMLRYYAERLPTVEMNSTFYRMPTRKVLEAWAADVPPAFRFVIKASQRITHMRRLRDARDSVTFLLDNVGVLGEKLGPVLFQLPPNLKKDVALLKDFLAALPAWPRAAFELRHASWRDDEVLEALRAHGAALCLAESDDAAEHDLRMDATARWGYLRLRRADYDDAALAAWAERLRAQPWDEAFVFFKHEDAGKGPALAARLSALLASAAASTPPAPPGG
ncbi:MAG TPA: DUF72 domain-containing protein [Myxococcota bacterium]|nr:DUF72 domain-containing protein [Myxococcota bacterium]